MNLDVDKFLGDLDAKHVRFYVEAVRDVFVAFVENDRTAAAKARERLAEVLRETMGAAEVLGATIMLRAAARAAEPETDVRDRALMARFAASPAQAILPRVRLDDALQDMVDRTPVTIRRAADRTAKAIAKLYSGGAVVAFVRAAEASVTKAAQEFITRAMKEGTPEGEAGRRLAMKANDIRKRSEEWTDAYARMAFRTNVNTAVTAGRFRMARDPDIKAAVPAFRFDSVGDSDTRHNHDAGDGVILSVDSPQWARIAPPLGYNCRCQVSHVTRAELEAAGRMKKGAVVESRVPASLFPDPGFRHGGRPDLFLVAR